MVERRDRREVRGCLRGGDEGEDWGDGKTFTKRREGRRGRWGCVLVL